MAACGSKPSGRGQWPGASQAATSSFPRGELHVPVPAPSRSGPTFDGRLSAHEPSRSRLPTALGRRSRRSLLRGHDEPSGVDPIDSSVLNHFASSARIATEFIDRHRPAAASAEQRRPKVPARAWHHSISTSTYHVHITNSLKEPGRKSQCRPTRLGAC